MCLATVYNKEAEQDSIILQYVSRIDVEGTTITLTDVMGQQKVVEGSVAMVDLANSIVKINCTESF